MDICVKCGKPLEFNDIGATKKFINRGATEFMCQELGVSEELIEKKIEQFKRQGCMLFV